MATSGEFAPRIWWSFQSALPATKLGLLAVITIVAGAPNVFAMQYSQEDVKPGVAFIDARGPIVDGDTVRFLSFAVSISNTTHVTAISLDSPGGNVGEAKKLAKVIQEAGLGAFVDGNAECSSSCFLLFAAASKQFAVSTALVGVHSVSHNGVEDTDAMAVTTEIAREAATYGVPPAIIGKMVQTPPGRVAWLTPEDLTSMGVVVFPATATSLPQPSSPVAPAPPPVQNPPSGSAYVGSAPATTPTAGYATAFQQGAADYKLMQEWVNSLAGDYRAGAIYWSGQRSLAHPGACTGPTGQDLGDFTAGCYASRQRFAPMDTRRKSEPEYRLGWNSH